MRVELKKWAIWGMAFIAFFFPALLAAEEKGFRPPAVPLVVCDPYFSIWSFADRLTDDQTRHWTGAVQELCGLVRIDGKTYRFLGSVPADLPAMKQVSLKVLPTRTIYEFSAAGVRLRLTFTTPLLPYNLNWLSLPITYLTWEVSSEDETDHQVSLYLDAAAEIAVNEPKQMVEWRREKVSVKTSLMTEELSAMCIGSQEQPILQKAGDNLRIDWGYLYLAAPIREKTTSVVGGRGRIRQAFVTDGSVPEKDEEEMPRAAAGDDCPAAAVVFDLGEVGAVPDKCQRRYIILAYDDIYSIELFGEKLRPYWRRGLENVDGKHLLQVAAERYADFQRRCADFDEELTADLARVGGPRYADLCALAYRQAIGAHKLAATSDGLPMLFPKECFSNGCISTVDVIYPAAPIFILFNSELLKASLRPVFQYAAGPRWRFPFAPHDLGKYPKADGQVYGGGEKSEKNQMPVEESANMLILAGVICRLENEHYDRSVALQYAQACFPLLERWANYLRENGLDPANQLCTDDFTGHLAHNANLSLKAIVALAAYAEICKICGRDEQAAEFRRTADDFARQWIKMADYGDHYRLAFDQPGTWSQKYNLVWDKLLGLKLFPPETVAKEVAFYKTRLLPFGLPLDSRATFTKTDWYVWTATLADSRDDFDALMQPLYEFVNHTPQRVPLTDWYDCKDAGRKGFQARPVIGGVFIKMLDDRQTWRKWQERSKDSFRKLFEIAIEPPNRSTR